MRNAEERLVRMHERAAAIKKKEDKSRLRILGSLSAGLMICLVAVTQQLQSMQHEIYTGRARRLCARGSDCFYRRRSDYGGNLPIQEQSEIN